MPRFVSWGITYVRMLVLPSQSVVVAVCSGIVGALLGAILTFVTISLFPGCRIASRMQLAATVDEIPKSKSGKRKEQTGEEEKGYQSVYCLIYFQGRYFELDIQR